MTDLRNVDYDQLRAILLGNGSKTNCTPLPEDFYEEYEADYSVRQHGVSIAYGIICVAGLLANVTVMFLLLVGGRKGTTFRAPSTILIMNLAIADTLFLLTLPFGISQRVLRGWIFGQAMCKLEEMIKFLNYYGSIFFITAMAVDRYLVVTRPAMSNRKMARRYMMIASGVLWCLALIAVIPLLIFSGVDEFGFCSIMFPRGAQPVHNTSAAFDALKEIECLEDYREFFADYAYDYEAQKHELISDAGTEGEAPSYVAGSGKVEDYIDYLEDQFVYRPVCKHPDVPSLHKWLVWNFVIGFVIPFIIITACYIRIMSLRLPMLALTPQRRRADQDNDNNNGNCLDHNSLREDVNKLICDPGSSAKKSNQKAKMLMNVLVPCLIVAFSVCWLPYHIFHLIRIPGVNMETHTCTAVRDFTFCLAFFNSALNPILNSFFLYNFKQRLQQSSSWVSSKLKNLSIKRKPNGDDTTAHLNGCNGHDETKAPEVTVMTTAICLDD